MQADFATVARDFANATKKRKRLFPLSAFFAQFELNCVTRLSQSTDYADFSVQSA